MEFLKILEKPDVIELIYKNKFPRNGFTSRYGNSEEGCLEYIEELIKGICYPVSSNHKIILYDVKRSMVFKKINSLVYHSPSRKFTSNLTEKLIRDELSDKVIVKLS